ELFWRHGYHAVSTDAICRAAGVTRSSLYHAYPSKEELALAAIKQVWSDGWAEICAIYDGDGDVADKFRRHLDSFVEAEVRLQAKYGAVMGSFDMALGVGVPDSVREATRSHTSTHGQRVLQSVSELLGPNSADQAQWVTQMITAAVSGTRIRARLTNDLGPLLALPPVVLNLIELARTAGGAKATSPAV